MESNIMKQIELSEEKAKILFESGYFLDIKSVAQAQVKVWIGRSLGLNEFQSLTGIYITPKGQIGLAAITMGSMVKSSGKYDYKIDKLDDTGCTITFFKVAGEKEISLGVSTFTDKDAIKCGLVNKDTYKSYPRNMLLARALANGARWYAPETICGCYAVEELDEWQTIPAKQMIELTEEGVRTNGEA